MTKNNLIFGNEDIKIYQDEKGFSFSLDTLCLASFVSIRKDVKKILDIGTGNAPIPLILTKRTSAPIIGVEIQKKSAELAKKSVKINKKDDQITIINEDIVKTTQKWESDSFTTIVCNPPFFEIRPESNLNKQKANRLARHEINLSLETIFKTARKLLINGGNLALVHRPERLVELIMLMKENNIEPKRIKLIYPKKNKQTNMVLVEGYKNGKKGLIIEEPLFVHNQNGTYTKKLCQYLKKGD